MLKVGDKYIHYTKYGGVNKGVVKALRTVYISNVEDGACYQEDLIINEKGNMYSLNEEKIYKMNRQLSPKEIERLNKLGELIINRKKL